MGVDHSADRAFALDDEDRISILQLLTLSPTQRLEYLLDELDFDEAVDAGGVND